jgi:23S rRNA pseudouridine955/2504/2580 synthase
MKQIVIDHADQGKKLVDVVRDAFLPEDSLKQTKRLIDANCCSVNKVTERFASRRVKAGDLITFQSHKIKKEKPKVIFDDEDFIIISKPEGVESDPGALGFPDFHLVHRLDKLTSGVMILAKNEKTKSYFEELFRERRIQKEYVALCERPMQEKEGIIEGNYGLKARIEGQSIWGTVTKGVYAKTTFQRLASSQRISCVLLKPYTGRTHQLRAHMSEKGHPIMGDYQYARREKRILGVSHLMLHAYKLSFAHPVTSKEVTFQAQPPSYFQKQCEANQITYYL